jgi:hypothetical protein
MEKSTPRRMAARSWLLLLCFAAVTTTGVLQAHAQPDSVGTFSPSDPTTECMYRLDGFARLRLLNVMTTLKKTGCCVLLQVS